MSALTTLAAAWPERTPVRHRDTGAVGKVGRCPVRDPIAADHAGRATTGHLLMHGSTPIVWIAWSDRPGCWMNPRWLQKVRTP